MQGLLLALALASSAPAQVLIELAPEPGTSATGQAIATYDHQLATELVGDLDGMGISATIAGPRSPLPRPDHRPFFELKSFPH